MLRKVTTICEKRKCSRQNFTHQLWGSTVHATVTVQAKMGFQVQVPGNPVGKKHE